MFVPPGLRIRDYPARTAMDPHHHEEASLSIVVGGSFRERIASEERDYARGQIAYLPAGVAHSQQFGVKGARQIILTARPTWVDYLADCKTRLADSPHANSPTFHELASRLLQEMSRDDGFSALACDGIILEIVAAFGRTSTAADASVQPPAWLCEVREFVSQNALAPPGMRQIAQLAGRHEIHVAREFRRFFGASLGTYMRRLRAEHAACLLLGTGMSISEVALECGFSSHSHLCREFKARLGMTPSQYRRRPG
ncbi:MAG TPA: AraC family transcriptional regulator [Steroidobacteraceae bacterium]|nr:AraC family transcriptional regulator [Steroidobacteraceae bacterium]